jgi:hypothetical protein
MAGDFRVRPVGLDRLTARLNRLAQNLPEAMGQELYRDMVGVMFESQKIVPYDEGDLHDSGETDRPEISGSSVSVSLHYGSATVDYALIQHEDLTLRHQQGGEAKFLESALHQWSGNGPKDVAERAIQRAGRR